MEQSPPWDATRHATPTVRLTSIVAGGRSSSHKSTLYRTYVRYSRHPAGLIRIRPLLLGRLRVHPREDVAPPVPDVLAEAPPLRAHALVAPAVDRRDGDVQPRANSCGDTSSSHASRGATWRLCTRGSVTSFLHEPWPPPDRVAGRPGREAGLKDQPARGDRGPSRRDASTAAQRGTERPCGRGRPCYSLSTGNDGGGRACEA